MQKPAELYSPLLASVAETDVAKTVGAEDSLSVCAFAHFFAAARG